MKPVKKSKPKPGAADITPPVLALAFAKSQSQHVDDTDDEQTGKEVAAVEQPTFPPEGTVVTVVGLGRRYINDKGTFQRAPEADVIEGEVVQVTAAERLVLARCITDTRRAFARLRSNMVDDITAVAESVTETKRRAKAAGVPFDSLFGDPTDETKFPFSQSLANRFVRIHKSGVLCTDAQRLPADLNSLDLLASTPEKDRPRVLEQFAQEQAEDSGGRNAEKMQRAKDAVVEERSPKAREKKSEGKNADPWDKADRAFAKMKDAEKEVRASTPKSKQPPKAAPEGDRDVKAETRVFCTGMGALMLSEVLAEVQAIIAEGGK